MVDVGRAKDGDLGPGRRRESRPRSRLHPRCLQRRILMRVRRRGRPSSICTSTSCPAIPVTSPTRRQRASDRLDRRLTPAGLIRAEARRIPERRRHPAWPARYSPRQAGVPRESCAPCLGHQIEELTHVGRRDVGHRAKGALPPQVVVVELRNPVEVDGIDGNDAAASDRLQGPHDDVTNRREGDGRVQDRWRVVVGARPISAGGPPRVRSPPRTG